MADRPMPPLGTAVYRLVPGATWGEALRVGRAETQELLRLNPDGYHDSCLLTLYLQWAAPLLRQEAAEESAAEVGAHILQFLQRR